MNKKYDSGDSLGFGRFDSKQNSARIKKDHKFSSEDDNSSESSESESDKISEAVRQIEKAH